MMDAKKLAGALAAICLLVVPVSGGAGEGPATGDVRGNVDETATAPFEGTVIERSLGEGMSETIVVTQGVVVRLVLHAPPGTELHLHGYDLAGTAGSEAPVVLTFRADHAGRFPIEAHGTSGVLGRQHEALAYLEVRPE